jgi:hypothetical protein
VYVNSITESTTFYSLRFETPPTWRGRVPIFISPRNKVAQSCPQTLGSLLVASYDSQGHGGCIRTRLHTGYSQINYVSPLYNFGTNRIQMTTSNSSLIIPCLSVAAETCVNSVATVWFPQAYPLLPKRA